MVTLGVGLRSRSPFGTVSLRRGFPERRASEGTLRLGRLRGQRSEARTETAGIVRTFYSPANDGDERRAGTWSRDQPSHYWKGTSLGGTVSELPTFVSESDRQLLVVIARPFESDHRRGLPSRTLLRLLGRLYGRLSRAGPVGTIAVTLGVGSLGVHGRRIASRRRVLGHQDLPFQYWFGTVEMGCLKF